MARAARRRLSLTRYFVVVSLVSVVALGLALVWVSQSVMRNQAVRLGTVTATSVSAYETYVHIRPTCLPSNPEDESLRGSGIACSPQIALPVSAKSSCTALH